MIYAFELAGLFTLSAFSGFAIPFSLSLLTQRPIWRQISVLLGSLALIGACAGIAGGMSRTAAVGNIIPAFLGLLGGVAVYLFGVDRSKGVIASFGAATLSISLLVGYISGSIIRSTPDDHREIRSICANAYGNADLLKNQEAFDRFRGQFGNLCDKAMSWRITD